MCVDETVEASEPLTFARLCQLDPELRELDAAILAFRRGVPMGEEMGGQHRGGACGGFGRSGLLSRGRAAHQSAGAGRGGAPPPQPAGQGRAAACGPDAEGFVMTPVPRLTNGQLLQALAGVNATDVDTVRRLLRELARRYGGVAPGPRRVGLPVKTRRAIEELPAAFGRGMRAEFYRPYGWTAGPDVMLAGGERILGELTRELLADRPKVEEPV
jgi:hypothetical protein